MRALILLLLSLPAHALTLSEQVANIAPGTWAPITAVNTASDVDPDRDLAANPWHPGGAWWLGNGYAGKWKSWNSAVLAPSYGTCGAILYYGGGHNDYWGSDITALDLCDGPTWKRVNDPYSASNPLPWPIPDGLLPDGSPVPQHTYDTLAFDLATNSLVTLNAMSNGSNSVTTPTTYVFSLDTRQWRGPFHHLGATYGVAAADDSRGVVWFQPQNGYPGQFSSVNAATGEFQYYGVQIGGGLDSMMGRDPIRDRLVRSNFRTSGTISEHSLTDPTLPWKTAEQVSKPAVTGGNTWAWSAQREAWIVWMSKLGPDVWEVKRTGENPTTGAAIYTWTALMDAANTVTPNPSNGGNPSYEKFQLVTVGGVEVLIGKLRLEDAIFAFRLPGGIIEPPPPPEPEDCTCEPEPCTCECVEQQASACEQPGVFYCDAFTAAREGTLFKGDATPVVEGGNLVLTLPSMSGPDAGGSYRVRFPPIGEGKFLAFAYRVKADAAAVALPGRKEFILWRGSSSCTDLELSQSHRQDSAVLNPYTACGARNFAVPLGKYDFRLQYPDYDCTYHGIRKSLEGCAVTHADLWESFYIEVALGNYGLPNSRVTMWHRTEQEPWRRYVHRDDFTFYGSGGFDRFMLTPYMTGKPRTVHPPGEVRYDHLVMATQPLDKALL